MHTSARLLANCSRIGSESVERRRSSTLKWPDPQTANVNFIEFSGASASDVSPGTLQLKTRTDPADESTPAL